MKSKKAANFLWDAFCLSSVFGLWPRFIEPKILTASTLNIQTDKLPSLKILHLSDLHLGPHTSDRFLKKIIHKSLSLKPDLIVFTGDFLCYSTLYAPQKLQNFLSQFQAPLGCFAILGNHDYSKTVSINEKGDYDVENSPPPDILKGFQLLFSKGRLTGHVTEKAKQIPEHPELVELIGKTPFKLLHNQTVVINDSFNLVGLGEHSLGRSLPEIAFKGYNLSLPGIILAHHPDSIDKLSSFPGELILSGHTHGGQVNLPWMWQKFCIMKNNILRRGLHFLHGKWIYTSRGVGSTFPFRLFSPPQITLIHLQRKSP